MMRAPSPGFSRRHFLSLSAMAAGACCAAPAQSLAATSPKNPWIYHFKIGELEAWSISDGFMKIGQGLKLMYPEDERDAMATALKQHSEPLDHLPLYVNVLVIRKGKEIALFDAGFGAPASERRGWLAAGLKEIGIHPDQVTATFLSHAHSDHIAGFVTDGKPTFKNAALNVTPEEYHFWRSKNPDFSKTKRNPKAIPGMVRQAQKRLEILTPIKQLTPVGASLFDGAVTVENGFGHTAGHAIYRIRSGDDELLHMVDLAHHHLLMFQKPTWKIGWDNNLELAAQTRKRVFTQAAAAKTRVFGFHVPFPGLGRINPLGDGFRWVPERLVW
ncbi:MBL fold metallo-hydrolase [Verrucomicrobiaceae bacterium R5-34]|uniref:MBL fold metallo-hydrolase n=1 Tax=Oceaniferula flava TaxID=2800421 RepID=A0AAE2S931_9BACT|nr:MBL fold metallo-hydrolase [Oceaniferula flavus]MBK1829193.1 MBL fold metallo-hydrolase [Verrucomicrobiaceae bacterium R5-34]MBK1853430.1 MBL fold metallo-hydrolase [Oceaniferula flavus]MBM1134735.1 MBL fold metallo-hydrolase [Oceaniferula flavus]